MRSPGVGSYSTEDIIYPFHKHFLSISHAAVVQDVSNAGSALKEHATGEESQWHQYLHCEADTVKPKQDGY